MDNSNVSEQADDESGDVQTPEQGGHTVSVIPQEDAGTTETNKDSKDWRKSDKEWQEAQEKAKKGQSASEQLEQIKAALKIEGKKSDQEPDVVKALTDKMDALETKLALSEWEKSHPAVDTAEYREAWAEHVKEYGDLVKSGRLTYDKIWDMVRKGSKPSTSNRDFRNQELSIGSVPPASKTVVTGFEIDPDVYRAMKAKRWTDEQIKMSA